MGFCWLAVDVEVLEGFFAHRHPPIPSCSRNGGLFYISPHLFGISFICVGLERVCACSVLVCLEITDLN